MGYNEDKGIIPLACDDMFKRIKENKDENLTYLVEVSYIEVINNFLKILFYHF